MTDQPIAEVVENSVELEAEQPEQNAEAGTAQEEISQEKSQPDYQKIIAEKAFEAREEKRKRKEMEERLSQLEAKNAPKEPEIPALPDRYDFDSDSEYQEAISKRDQAIIEKSQYDAANKLRLDQELEAKKQQEAQAQEALNEKAQAYTARAEEFKIEPDELKRCGDLLMAYELRPDIAEVILGDDTGPLITKYLAANPDKIQSLNSSTWANGAVLFNQVKEQASALRPRVTNAPEPVEPLQGGLAGKKSMPSGMKIW